MLAYTFSFILILLCSGLSFSYLKASKPEQLYVNPTSAKSWMLDKYVEVEHMPTGVSKIQAHEHWQKDCDNLYQKILKDEAQVNIEAIDRKA